MLNHRHHQERPKALVLLLFTSWKTTGVLWLLLLLLFGLLLPVGMANDEVFYVMEPFEALPTISNSSGWFQRVYNQVGKLNLTIVSKQQQQQQEQEAPVPLFGNGALKVDYTVARTENGGRGFVDWGYILGKKNSTTTTTTTATAAAHNCHGAQYLSLWYYNQSPQSRPGRVHLRIILLDDSDCPASDDDDHDECTAAPGQGLENYYSFHYILDNNNNDSNKNGGWQELRVALRGSDDPAAPFWQTGWAGSGASGNHRLDLEHIRGWRMELSMDASSQGATDDDDDDIDNNTSSGVLWLDQLSCVGGGDLLGAAFWTNDNPATTTSADYELLEDAAVSTGSWFSRYYESPLAKNRTRVDLSNGTLFLNYTIEQTESWGGFNDYQHLAPGPAYYNLSAATGVSLGYDIRQAASAPGRSHLRIILMDASDCVNDCASYPGQSLENYYSFHYILDGGDDDDDDDKHQAPGQIQVRPLRGEDNSSSPFWRTGWTGIVGNNVLDTAYVKGYRLELNVDSQGGVGSTVSGSVAFQGLVAETLGGNDDDDDDTTKDATCTREPGLFLNVESSSSHFKRLEFLGSKCCESCDKDPECLYALSDGKDCYVTSTVQVDAPGLLDTEFAQTTFTAFSTNKATKRGDFCQVCQCEEGRGVIDCRAKNLSIVPQEFLQRRWWLPRVLDLRDNPKLVILGSSAFESIAEGLEELLLPRNIRHLSYDSVQRLPNLSIVRFEGEHGSDRVSAQGSPVFSLEETDRAGVHDMNNVITTPSGHFGSVCCNRGQHIKLSQPSDGLTFCDMRVKTPGIDAVYEPFKLYIEASPLLKLRPRSGFMGEAAESVQKCAEYCAISDGCNYFSYDARWKESEHKCILLLNNGTSSVLECCNPDDYADSGGTAPGWTSGRPPRTRHNVDNARVVFQPQKITVSRANNYTASYEISLGSTPLRGAVWIEPKVKMAMSGVDLLVTPQRIALYDKATTATVSVTVFNADSIRTGATFVVSNHIQSCDEAFTAVASQELTELSTVYIDVIATEDMTFISPTLKAIGIGFVALQGMFSAFFGVWTLYYRGQGVVMSSQPVFLLLVVIGCFIMSISILPTAVEETYRYEQDHLTGQLTDTPSQDIDRVDAACMAFPWLFNLGFIVTFSALFAKIWRVCRILRRSSGWQRTVVLAKDVAGVMVAFTLVQFILLLAWQLVDPLRWQRQVLQSNARGYPLASVGSCTSDKALSFVIPLSAYNFGCLLYALYLCYRTRNFSSELNEAKWITASIVSIFQILLLAVPVLIIAWEDTNAFYFVRASVITLMSMGVTCFIFVPKFVQFHFHQSTTTARHDRRRRGGVFVSGSLGPWSGGASSSNKSNSIHKSELETDNNRNGGGVDRSPSVRTTPCFDLSSKRGSELMMMSKDLAAEFYAGMEAGVRTDRPDHDTLAPSENTSYVDAAAKRQGEDPVENGIDPVKEPSEYPQQKSAQTSDCSRESALNGKAETSDCSRETALNGKAETSNGSRETALNGKAETSNGSRESALHGKADTSNGSRESALNGKDETSNGSIYSALNGKDETSNGSRESALNGKAEDSTVGVIPKGRISGVDREWDDGSTKARKSVDDS